MSSEPIRVLIVDDHAMVRVGLRLFMLSMEGIDLVGEATDGAEALGMCDELLPDVVLMDLVMPEMDGISAIRALNSRHPEIRVLALSSFQDGERVRDALQAGAIGYLLKDIPPDELAAAIRNAHRGRRSLAPEAAQALVDAALDERPEYGLSTRQLEVLALMVEGKSNAEIAQALTISLATARFHVSTILSKMGAANRAEAAALAVKYSLVP
jgi:two-component system, NarL family, response regulator LiaR